MATLAQLRGTMILTIFIVLAFFTFFLAVIMVLLNIHPALGVAGALIFIILEYAIGPAMVVLSTGLRYVSPGSNPWLESVVYDLSAKSGIPPPKLAIVGDRTPNAFVFGHTIRDATLAIHIGLLERLNQNEVKGVIGHEIGHIKHRDFIVMTMLSALPLMCYLVARGLFWDIDTRTGRKREKEGAKMAVAVISYVAYIISLLLVLKLSRLRENYADAYSAYLTGSPRSLGSALTKIAYGLSLKPEEPSGARALYISDPAQAASECQKIIEKKDVYDLDRDGVLDEKELELAMEKEAKSTWTGFNEAFMTHPPTYRRLILLLQVDREMREGRYTAVDIYKNI